MGYTDVMHPVIVNVTQSTSFSVDNYLRRTCVVSCGESNLNPNEWRSVGTDTWSAAVKGSELQNFCNSFFSFAGNKELVILEVGAETTEGRKPLCDAVKMFIEKEEAKCYNYALPKAWFSPKTISKTDTFTIAEAKFVANTEATTINIDTTLPNEEILSSVDKENVIVWDAKAFSFKKADGAASGSFPVTITFKRNIAGTPLLGSIKVYGEGGSAENSSIAWTHTATSKDSAVNDMLRLFSVIEKEICFFISVPWTEDANASTDITALRNLKAAHCVIQNSEVESISAVGIVCGICASSYFDISDDMPASALNYKAVRNYTPSKSSAPQRKAWIDSALTFIESLAGQNVVLNGRHMDGTPWDYYYYWYLTKFRVSAKISKLILNGANNPISAIGYDQTGIDTLKINIMSELDVLKGWGVITEYARSYDANSGEFKDAGQIVAPQFYKYIAENPENYKNEILGGFSAFIQIGRFVRQVEWNVTLGG